MNRDYKNKRENKNQYTRQKGTRKIERNMITLRVQYGVRKQRSCVALKLAMTSPALPDTHNYPTSPNLAAIAKGEGTASGPTR